MGLHNLSIGQLVGAIRSWEPDVMGVSSLSLEAGLLRELAAAAKEARPQMKIVTGGPHSTYFYDWVLDDKNVDYAVTGEGEETFIELLDHLREGTNPGSIPGLAYRRDGELFYGGDRPYITEYDSIPIPAWDLIDISKYSKMTNPNGYLARSPFAVINSSRGCPYGCIYCHNTLGKRFRAASPNRVLEEIEYLSELGVREIHFADDVFNFDVNRAMEIFSEISRRGIDMMFAFPNGIRGDIMSHDMIDEMARAGVYSMQFGVESASPRIQRLIHKNLNLDKLLETTEYAHEKGIITGGFFMLGFPTETLEEINRTIDFAVNSKMLKASFSTAMVLPRTQMHELVKQTYPDYDLKYEDPSDFRYRKHRPYYAEVTGIDIESIQKQAWRKFYFKPWRMYNILKMCPINRSFLQMLWYSFMVNFRGAGLNEET